jgi:hypothetical protein
VVSPLTTSWITVSFHFLPDRLSQRRQCLPSTRPVRSLRHPQRAEAAKAYSPENAVSEIVEPLDLFRDREKAVRTKRTALLSLIFILCILLLAPGSALAQDYSYELPRQTLDAYWNSDGTLTLDYRFFFQNDPGASPIDFVDVPMPNNSFDEGSVSAWVDDIPLTFISRGDYQGTGTGVAVGLGDYAIPPGGSGEVRVLITGIERMLYPDSDDENYVSAVMAPAWFEPGGVHGTTDLTVTFHLPEGVQPEEPRWHASPSGFPSEPETGFDDQGRVTYTWRSAQADPTIQKNFGASFPLSYVPAESVVRPDPMEWLATICGAVTAIAPFLIFCGILVVIGAVSAANQRRRKLQYLPPKISIEGHGIKRGLTAVEAAILMEQPLDKVLTMILFGVIKKGAATVRSREPLEIEVAAELPEGLHPYERSFLQAFSKPGRERRSALQKMMVELVREVSRKMKGFSRRETIAYYDDIIKRAWSEVEAADTPEVKSQKYDEVMEWTMLDRNYEGRTREVFRSDPVYVPVWWPRYDPTYGRGTTTTGRATPTTAPSQSSQPSMPTLPGSAFAGSVVTGVQNFATSVVGNLTDFTSRITSQTNPPPKTTSSTSSGRSGGGGGCACACACACAGCACACAGGGR